VAPYRSEGWQERAEAPRDPGIVGEVISQFADRYAFLRELVQNAIDAGTDAVEVRLEYAAQEHTMRITVRDQGEGMTRDIVENQLLVLFRSTKEKDDSKIGKFGIGFASVLAPQPRIVTVQTARDGQRLTLHLHPDLTYQLFDGGAATHSGTSVELELPMGNRELAEHMAEKSLDALVRWCRHAAVPIHYTATGVGDRSAQGVRVDRPLSLSRALVEVSDATDDGKLLAVVGVHAAGKQPYAGFFNHGLMLHETHAPLLGRLSFKVQDPRLGHTLSRDDVRRDERFHHALAFARQVAEEQLPAKVAAELRRAAEEDPDHYQALALAIDEAQLELRDEEWAIPLLEPVNGRRSIAAAALGKRAWVATQSSRLTSLLARAGIPVLSLHPGALRQRLTQRLAAAGCALAELSRELTLVQPLEPSAADFVVISELQKLLAAAHRAPSAVILARLEGAGEAELFITGGVRDAVHTFPGGEASADAGADAPETAAGAPYALDGETTKRSPFALLRSPPLVLSAAHPLMRAARQGEPRLAASHLARLILLHYRLLTAERSEILLDQVLTGMGVA
jgi:rRNA-processing protein FCF1